MSNVPASQNNNTDRQDVLNAIGTKWNRFSKQELSALKTNDELVSQVVAKYGIEKAAAQHDVDALMNGRNLTA